MEQIEYLYHYTSIESLALILKNRTIRLNPLDKMDDLQEQKTADVENLGKFVFVSSWTEDAKESIPMWNMYTPMVSGVRIKLRKNPFVWHSTCAKDFSARLGSQLSPDSDPNETMPTFLDLSELIEKGYMTPQAFKGDVLKQVEYTDELSKLEPTVSKLCDGRVEINIGSLGCVKNTHWEFQKEWRYIMFIMSMNYRENLLTGGTPLAVSVSKLLQGKESPPFRYFDLELDSKYFEEMEIVCSPKMTMGNRVILEGLVEKYNPKARIIESELLGKI